MKYTREIKLPQPLPLRTILLYLGSLEKVVLSIVHLQSASGVEGDYKNKEVDCYWNLAVDRLFYTTAIT